MSWGAIIGALVLALIKGLFGTDKPREVEVIDAKPDFEVDPHPDSSLLDELGL